MSKILDFLPDHVREAVLQEVKELIKNTDNTVKKEQIKKEIESWAKK